jgi:hypothetical protein
MADEIEESTEEENDKPGKNQKVRQARVKLPETPVLFIRPEELAVDENIDKSRAAKGAETLTPIVEPVGGLTDAPPAGEPDDGVDKDSDGDSSKGVHYPGVLDVPENHAGGVIHDFYLPSGKDGFISHDYIIKKAGKTLTSFNNGDIIKTHGW